MRTSSLVLLALLLTIGCAAQEGASPEVASTPADTGAAAISQRRIAYRADVRLVVEHFDEVPSQVDALTARFDGFISHADLQGAVRDRRRGTWTMRVPAEQYRAVLQSLCELGEVVSLQSSSEDKTTEWVDLDARLRNAQAGEQRLLAVLRDATGELNEILTVEKELARVRGDIEQMQSRQRMLDDLVSLSTITLVVDEIKNFFPERSASYFTRARRSWEVSLTALATMIQDLSLLAIAILPWLLALALPLALMVLAIYHYRRRRRVRAQVVT